MLKIRFLRTVAVAAGLLGAGSASAIDLTVTHFGTGMYGRTPVGTFRIQDKIENPPIELPITAIPSLSPWNFSTTAWLI